MRLSLIIALVATIIAMIPVLAADAEKSYPVPTIVEKGSHTEYGYKDKRSGKWVIKPQYDLASPFSEGLANVEINGRSGYIDTTGKIVIKIKYDAALPFGDGLAPVNTGGWGFIDKNGNMAIKPRYEDAWPFSEGLAGVKTGNKWGFIDKQGNIAIEPKYATVHPFSEGYSMVTSVDSTGPYGIIDKSGQLVIDFGKYNGLGILREGVMPAKNDMGWGYIDKDQNWVIKPQFEGAIEFHEGMAAIQKGGKWGFIDKSGNIVAEPIYDDFESYNGGLAYVSIYTDNFDGYKKRGYIDRSGNWVRDY